MRFLYDLDHQRDNVGHLQVERESTGLNARDVQKIRYQPLLAAKLAVCARE